MNELIIELEEIAPKEFFGAQNVNIELLKKYFPKLKIVARGNKITAYGDDDMLEEFDRRMTMLTTHFGKYNKLDENTIERVLTSQTSADYTTSDQSGEVLVHGVGGKLIKAQTLNQRRLVESMRQNDMVFAIGPAGIGCPGESSCARQEGLPGILQCVENIHGTSGCQNTTIGMCSCFCAIVDFDATGR